MPNLHVLIYKPCRWFLPRKASHWALLLLNEDVNSDDVNSDDVKSGDFNSDDVGIVFDVQKNAFKSKKTQFATLDFKKIRDNVHSAIALEIQVTEYQLNMICQDVSKNRPFHLLSRNCQHWVLEVIKRLVEELHISNGDEIIHNIKRLGHVPITERFIV